MRVAVPQKACLGFDHGGRRYTSRNGILDVPDHVARDLIKHDQCFPVADKPRTDGYVCDACGFATYFKVCGRCGATCHRPSHQPVLDDVAYAARAHTTEE